MSEDLSKIVNAYVPVPMIAYGIISEISDDRQIYNVQITDSALGSFGGHIACQAVASPGTEENYRVNDRVIVSMSAAYDLKQGRIDSVAMDSPKVILGVYRMPAAEASILNTADTSESTGTKYLGKDTRSGMVVDDAGGVALFAEGSVRTGMNPGGKGSLEDSKIDEAQNYHKIIANFEPDYQAREHFGMNTGGSDLEQAAAIPGKTPIVRRRFVPGDDSFTKFVSSTEGAKAPLVGCNSSQDPFTDSDDEVAKNEFVQSGDFRFTVETGKQDQNFHTLRIDKVISAEKEIAGVLMPAILGNVANIIVGTDGELDMRGGGTGSPAGNMHKYQVQADKDGNVNVFGNGKLILSHSPMDVDTNSITIDPDNGIDIKADKGFRVNGQHLATEAFVDFFKTYQASLCLVTAIGGPAPIHPTALADFNAKSNLFAETGGFKTNGAGAKPLMKKIIDNVTAFFKSI